MEREMKKKEPQKEKKGDIWKVPFPQKLPSVSPKLLLAGGVSLILIGGLVGGLSALKEPLPASGGLLRVCKGWNTLVVEDSAWEDGDVVRIGGKEIKLSKKAKVVGFRVGSFRESYELIVKGVSEGLFAPITLRLRILETGSEYLMNFREGKVFSISTELIRCANRSEGR